MHVATVQLKSVSPYSQSRKIQSERDDKETSADFEKRTWRERIHVDSDGNMFVPPMALKNCIAECAKFRGEQIPGKGKSTYTKHFEAGILVIEPMLLGVRGDDVQGEWLYVPSDGRRGGPKRVDKCFPVIPKWEGTAIFHILDDAVTKDVFERHIVEAWRFIGMGRFRPRNNGYYGRFEVVSLSWE